MEPFARIRDWPSATAASPAITQLEQRVSALSPENVNPDRRATPSSCGGGECQRQQDAATDDRPLEERPPAWGEQTSSSCYRLKGQWCRLASLLTGKGCRHGGEQRAARSAILSLRTWVAALHEPDPGKLRLPVVLPEPRSAAEALNAALVREIEQSQWLAVQRAADPLLMSTALARRHDPPCSHYRQKRRAPRSGSIGSAAKRGISYGSRRQTTRADTD